MKMYYRLRGLAAVSLVALAALTQPAVAQTARSGGTAGANAQLMQQLASERTALQAENARMKKELADLAKERDTLKSGRSALEQEARANELSAGRNAKDKESAELENTKLKERMQELVTKFRETATTLRDVETERTAFKQSIATRDAELNQCIERNVALYKLNGEVLTRLENQGVWSRVASTEPFTKIKRVQLENLIDDYKYRAEEQKANPSTASSAERK